MTWKRLYWWELTVPSCILRSCSWCFARLTAALRIWSSFTECCLLSAFCCAGRPDTLKYTQLYLRGCFSVRQLSQVFCSLQVTPFWNSVSNFKTAKKFLPAFRCYRTVHLKFWAWKSICCNRGSSWPLQNGDVSNDCKTETERSRKQTYSEKGGYMSPSKSKNIKFLPHL